MRILSKIKDFFLIDMIIGFSKTFKYFFSKKYTLSYPFEKSFSSSRFRGEHALRCSGNDELCIACRLCEVVCPAQAITIVSEFDNDRRVATRYDIDYNKCIFCGLCAEACPTNAIVETHNQEIVVFRKSDMVYSKQKLLTNGAKWENVLQEVDKQEKDYS